MAQYFTNFSSETVGSPPAGWTFSNLGTGTSNVLTDGSAPGGKILQLVPQSGVRFTHAYWNIADSDPNVGNAEVVVLVRFPDGLEGFYQGCKPTVRTNYSGVYCNDGFDFDAYNNIIIGIGFEPVAFGNIFGAASTSQIYAIRFSAQGTALKAWYWLFGGTVKNQTDTPDLSGTDATYSTGSIGVTWDTNSAFRMDLLAIGIGTNGDPAPLSVGGSVPAQTLTSQTFHSMTMRR
jgi:hypothetical protein